MEDEEDEKKSRNFVLSYRVILPLGQLAQEKEKGVSREEMETGGIWTWAPPSPTGAEWQEK